MLGLQAQHRSAAYAALAHWAQIAFMIADGTGELIARRVRRKIFSTR
jgi:hypothetical protein